MQDLHIYSGDVPNQFKIKIDSKNGLLPVGEVRKCCHCPPGKCKKMLAQLGFKAPSKVLKTPPRAFILRRNIYRNFANFFKDLFAKYTKKFMNLRCDAKKKSEKMHGYLNEFIDENFDQQYLGLSAEHQKEFMIALKQVLFSHRHKKDDLFIEGIDFSPVRGVMYSYSYKARDEFFDSNYRCFFFNFCLEKHKAAFLKKARREDTKNLIEEYEKEFGAIEDILKTKSINQWIS